ncbi:hypothetical protein [Natronomonas aquatica]|jgi:hypothetical protein|nr:hypothetical protein [Natronomonas aquatica]
MQDRPDTTDGTISSDELTDLLADATGTDTEEIEATADRADE